LNRENEILKNKATCAQAVYFLHSTMPSVMYLQLSDVSIICRDTYLQFPMQACFSSMSVSQAAQRHIWFTQYRTLLKVSKQSASDFIRIGSLSIS